MVGSMTGPGLLWKISGQGEGGVAQLQMKPLRPCDREAYESAVSRLSARTMRLRFGGPRGPLTTIEIGRFLDVGQDGREAVAVWSLEESIIVAIGRVEPVANGAELAVVVDDLWQGRGIGTVLAGRLIDVASKLGYVDLYATTDYGNLPAVRLLHHCGFHATWETTQLHHRPVVGG
jgi:GNAT superfamily N-acetyltransferase